MIDLLEYIIHSIVDEKESVEIEESGSEDERLYTLHVDPSDMGKVIGKHGKTIHAIRTLLFVRASKEGCYAQIQLAESKKS